MGSRARRQLARSQDGEASCKGRCISVRELTDDVEYDGQYQHAKYNTSRTAKHVQNPPVGMDVPRSVDMSWVQEALLRILGRLAAAGIAHGHPGAVVLPTTSLRPEPAIPCCAMCCFRRQAAGQRSLVLIFRHGIHILVICGRVKHHGCIPTTPWVSEEHCTAGRKCMLVWLGSVEVIYSAKIDYIYSITMHEPIGACLE